MASIIKKLEKENPDDYVSSGSNNPISKKHYRPFHYKLQKHQRLFTNDWIDCYSDDYDGDGDWEAGTDKRRWKAHDYDGFDDWKDGN